MFSAPHSSSNPQARQFAGAYHQVGVQTMVSGASAHGLVALLFDGFMAAVHRAKGAMRHGDIAGGKLAADLSDLYAYVCLRLIQANLNSDEAALDECLRLVTPLRDAWQAIGDRVNHPVKS